MGTWKPRRPFQRCNVATAEANPCRSRCAPLFFHRVMKDSSSLCTQPVKPLASMHIQQPPLEQQQFSRASASTPTSATSRCPRDILTPWRPAVSSTGGAAVPRPRGAPRRNSSSGAPWRLQSSGLGSPRRRLTAAGPSGAAHALGSTPRGPGSHGCRPRQAAAGSGCGPRAGDSGSSGGRRYPPADGRGDAHVLLEGLTAAAALLAGR